MAVSSFAELNEMHLSVLQELGNMGSGGAATSLATMLSTATDISVPTVRRVTVGESKRIVSALSTAAYPLLIKLGGDFSGFILHLLPVPYINRVVGTYFPDFKISSPAEIDEMVSSVINETVNITSASYANALAELSKMFVDISTPKHTLSAADEIFKNYKSDAEIIYFVNNTFVIKDQNVSGNMVYFPELKSLCTLMEKIGVPC